MKRNMSSWVLSALFFSGQALAQTTNEAPLGPAPTEPTTPTDAAPAAAAAPAEAVASPQPAAAASEAKPEKPLAEPASKEEPHPAAAGKPPEKLTVSKVGFIQLSSNLQVWAVAEKLGTARTDDNKWQSTLRIRRAEIRAKGEIVPGLMSYMVMFDPARLLDFKSTQANVKDSDGKTIGTVPVVGPPGAQNGSTVITGASSSILQDVQLTLMSEYADFSIGQFKIPISMEGAGAASKLYFPERSLVARRFGDRRDLGFKIDKKFDHFSYWVAVYNGEGQNNLDSNDQKDLAARFEVYPIKEVTIAAAGYTSVGDRDLVGTKDRIEGDLKFEKYGLLVQAEAIRGWDVVGTATAHTRQKGQGFYALLGYTFADTVQPVVRIGSIDPKVGDDEHGSTTIDPNDEITAYEFGINYYLKQHDAKFQLAGSYFDPEQKVAKSTFDLILATQVAF